MTRESHQSLVWLLPLILVLIILPLLLPEYYILLAGYVLIAALLAQSFNIMFGYMGKLSFGHAAFFGLGAYTVAILSVKTAVPLFLSIPLAISISAPHQMHKKHLPQPQQLESVQFRQFV